MKNYRNSFISLFILITALILTSCGSGSSTQQEDVIGDKEQNLSVGTYNKYILGSLNMPDYAMDITISMDETTAFIAGHESGLQIVDISNPSALHIIGSIETAGEARSIWLSTDETKIYILSHAKIPSESNLQIIDVSNSMNPSIICILKLPTYPSHITVNSDDTKAFITLSGLGMYIIDLSNINAPSILSSIKTSDYMESIFLSGDEKTAYVATWYTNIDIIDISNPTTPLFTDSINTPSFGGGSITLSSDKKYAYTTDDSSDLQILYISNPKRPSLLSTLEIPKFYESTITLSSDETKAIIVNSRLLDTTNILIVDITDRTQPSIIQSIDIFDAVSDTVLSSDGTKAYITDYTYGLKIIDLTVPTPEYVKATVSTLDKAGAFVTKIARDENRTIYEMDLIGEGSENFTINTDGDIHVAVGAKIDILVPSYTLDVIATNSYGKLYTAIVEIETTQVETLIEMNNDMNFILSLDETKVFSLNKNGLSITDISSPNPTLLGYLDLPVTGLGFGVGIALSPDENMVYIANGSTGMTIVNISDPTAPTIISSIEIGDYASCIVLSFDGTKAFVGDSVTGLQIIDVKNPASPFVISSLDMSNDPFYITLLSDTKILIADFYSNLYFVDISNLESPSVIRFIDTPEYSNAVVLSKDETKVFIANGHSSFQVMDINDSTIPSIISSTEIDVHASNLVISSDETKAFITSYFQGLEILDITDITAPFIIDSTPRINVKNVSKIVLSSDESKLFILDSSAGLQAVDIR